MCEYGGYKNKAVCSAKEPSFTQLTCVDHILLRSTDSASYSILTRPFWSQPESIWTAPKEFVFSPWVTMQLILHINLLTLCSQWKQTKIADKLFTWSWFTPLRYFFSSTCFLGLVYIALRTVKMKHFNSQTRQILSFAGLSIYKKKAHKGREKAIFMCS